MKIINFFRKKERINHEFGNFLFLGGGLGIKEKKISDRKKNAWVEDSFINYSLDDLGRQQNYLGTIVSKKTIAFFLLAIFFGLLILSGRAFYLQGLNGKYYLSLAEKNRVRLVNISSPRGIIYDLKGRPLVKNIPTFAVYLVPAIVFEEENRFLEIKDWLRRALPEFSEELENSFVVISNMTKNKKEFYEPVLLLDKITHEQAIAVSVESIIYPGVTVDVLSEREYLHSFSFGEALSLSHLLGYKGKVDKSEYEELKGDGYLFNDSIGKSGIELWYEKNLRGRYGREKIEVDSSGNAVKMLGKEEMIKGDNLYLNIDVEIQSKLENIIKNYLQKTGKKRVSAIVMNPNNGKILSLISLPAYDNNLFTVDKNSEAIVALLKSPEKPLFNRVVGGNFPSGSTIKPVVALGALEDGIIDENTGFMSSGGIRISSWFFPDWKSGGHGFTNVKKAIAESVNTFFYIIGGGYGGFTGLGLEKLTNFYQKFGLNSKTGIDLPGEVFGFVPSAEWKKNVKGESWYIGDTYHLSIGQGDLLVTPLQVAVFTSAIVNGGRLVQPQLVDRVYERALKQEIKILPQVKADNLADKKNLQIVKEGMRQAVTMGSARVLGSLPVSSGAKTGTAQWGKDKENHAWFTAFAPFEEPEVVVTILVEEAGEGSAVSAPLTAEFLNWYFRVYKSK